MAQLTRGSVSVTNGSKVVTGDASALFSTGIPAVTVGDLFKVNGETIYYTVASIDSDTQITLTETYAGTTNSGLNYTITQDFYVNLNMIKVNKGDSELAEILERNFKALDTAYGSVSVTRKETVVIYQEGNAVDETVIFDGLYPDIAFTIEKVAIHAKTAPTGSNLTIDLLKNGAEQSRVATLTAGSSYEETDISDLILNASDRLGLKIKSVGSTVAGAGISVVLHINKSTSGIYHNVTNVYQEGNAVDETNIIDGIYLPVNADINKITIHALTAPTGSNLTIDLLKDGAEQSKVATLTAGSTYETTTISSLSYTTSQRLGLKIKSVGSTVAGAKINVCVHWTQT